MRVTSISMHANEEEVVRFSLRAEKADSRYMVRQITGLDAEEITPKFYGFGQSSGAKYYDFGMKPRELVIRVILNPTFALNEEHFTIRDELYRAISSSRTGKIQLRFHSGGGIVAKLEGFITKLEAGYFNKTPEAQLTVRCDDPMFRAMNPVRLEAADIPNTNPLRLADSISTAPHGFTACIDILNPIADFTVQDREVDPDWYFNVVPNGGFLAGDELYFSSDAASKYLYLDRGGAITHLIDRIEPGSVWPQIFPGGNEVYFADWGDFVFECIEYHPAYWGV